MRKLETSWPSLILFAGLRKVCLAEASSSLKSIGKVITNPEAFHTFGSGTYRRYFDHWLSPISYSTWHITFTFRRACLTQRPSLSGPSQVPAHLVCSSPNQTLLFVLHSSSCSLAILQALALHLFFLTFPQLIQLFPYCKSLDLSKSCKDLSISLF